MTVARNDFVQKPPTAVRRAIYLGNAAAMLANLKPLGLACARDVEEAHIVRYARQIFRFDCVPWRNPAGFTIPLPEFQQPTLIYGPDGVRPYDLKVYQ